jgi:hypothetical protein
MAANNSLLAEDSFLRFPTDSEHILYTVKELLQSHENNSYATNTLILASSQTILRSRVTDKQKKSYSK